MDLNIAQSSCLCQTLKSRLDMSTSKRTPTRVKEPFNLRILALQLTQNLTLFHVTWAAIRFVLGLKREANQILFSG